MLQISLLGRFRVERDGEALKLESRPVQRLLAYLVLHPDVEHRRDKIAGILWPESSESNARSNLRHALWQLRLTLGDENLFSDKTSLSLRDETDYEVDVERLESDLSASKATEKWIEAVASYEGELLPGFYEDWVLRARDRLDAVFQQKMQLLLDRLVEEARWDEVIHWAERWISHGQVPEPAYRMAMLAHAALGDVSAMASTYQRCVEALEAELGVEPSAETEDLYRQLASGETPAGAGRDSLRTGRAAARVRHNLPAMATAFIGRTTEIEALIKLLDRPETRLVTLTGTGGTGKTRLALQVGEALLNRFEHGVWFVDLSPVADAALVPSTIAGVLGLKEQGETPVIESLKDFLADRQVLLIVDNFEHLLAGANSIAELLTAAPGLRCLATSREILHVYGEQDFPVLPLALPDPAAVKDASALAEVDVVRLFEERATAVSSGFRLTDQNASAVVEICRRLDGLPLAIELAAARVRLFTPQALLERLSDRLETLTAGPRNVPARQRTLRGALDWSYGLLDPVESRLFARLAVFQGGGMLGDIEAICGHDLDGDLLETLQSLLDKSLLNQRQGAGGQPRIYMLETIREFAQERLDASGETDLLRKRHADVYTRLAEEGEEGLNGPESLTWIEHMEEDHDNFRVALERSQSEAGDPLLGLRMASALGGFWVLRGYLHEGHRRVLAALDDAGEIASTELRAKAHYAAARIAYRQNNLEAAESDYQAALDLHRQTGDKAGIAASLVGLGMVATEHGEYSSAPGVFNQALELSREVDHRDGISNALTNLGWAAMRTGDLTSAEAYLLESLEVDRSSGDRSGQGFNLSGLGEAYLRMGDLERATRYLDESLAVRSELGEKWGMAASLGSLGWVGLRQNDLQKASEALHQSLALRFEIGDKGGMAWCLEKLAQASIAGGNLDRAARLYGGAAALRRSIDSSIDPADMEKYEQRIENLKTELGEEEFSSAWAEGEVMTLAVLIAYALEA